MAIKRQSTVGGKLHSTIGPALEYMSGDKYWYINGKLHRDSGPAVELSNGTKKWYRDGKLHREDGPAIEWENGTKYWYLHGKRHREDGPAVEYSNGAKFWYVNDKIFTEEEFNLRTRKSDIKYIVIKNDVFIDDFELPQRVAACASEEYASKICEFLNKTFIEKPYIIFR